MMEVSFLLEEAIDGQREWVMKMPQVPAVGDLVMLSNEKDTDIVGGTVKEIAWSIVDDKFEGAVVTLGYDNWEG
jgi:hypothetical protein|tara:strand:+ start:957 stop:1178 length:222 start_codon:yes stop_codon:yes gene_type:complete